MADAAAAAAAIVDDHGLADRLLERLLDRARQRVGAAARRERHDDVDRLRRKGLCDGGSGDSADRQRPKERLTTLDHCSLLIWRKPSAF